MSDEVRETLIISLSLCVRVSVCCSSGAAWSNSISICCCYTSSFSFYFPQRSSTEFVVSLRKIFLCTCTHAFDDEGATLVSALRRDASHKQKQTTNCISCIPRRVQHKYTTKEEEEIRCTDYGVRIQCTDVV